MAHSIDAWLVCNDLLIRAKNMLYAEALDIFERSRKQGRISVQGSFVRFEEPQNSNDAEFLLLKFLERKDEMVKYYESQLSSGVLSDSQKKNLLAFLRDAEAMSTLVEYSRIFDEWAAEALHEVKESNVPSLLSKGIKHKPVRMEALHFLLSDIKVSKDVPFSEGEINMLEQVAGVHAERST
ncbi:MAG: hypothetical protein ACP5TK_02425 [Candidatus Micrarchaeia archaeon]